MFPSTTDNPSSTPQSEAGPNFDPDRVLQIPLDKIKRNPYQPRLNDYREDLAELIESVKLHGVIHPVLVRQIEPDRFELIAGERRCSAAYRAGLESVPAIVREMNALQSAEVALIENIQREDLSPVEMACAFCTLMKDFHLSQKDVSERVGKSQPAISELLRLLELPEEILESLQRGDIQERHARSLLKIADREQQLQLWQQILAEKLTTREIEKRVREHNKPVEETAKVRARELLPNEETASPDTAVRLLPLKPFEEARLVTQLTEKFATRVWLRRHSERGGHLEICFYDDAALRQLAEKLLAA